MSRLRTILTVLAVGGAALVAGAGAGALWVRSAVSSRTTEVWTVHAGEVPIPPPLTDDDLAVLRSRVPAPVPEGSDPDGAAVPDVDPLAGADLGALARDLSAERGKHLVESRYACIECHGPDFGGGKMIDDPMIGKVLGPNLTLGRGSVTAAYTAADWDRKVRHGVQPDGRSGPMPSEDYQRMSDRELADIVSYVRSLPPVDREVAPVSFGPLGSVLVATDQLRMGAARLAQVSTHPALPPPTADTVEFGDHVLGVCTGCHRADFSGGPVPGGPPDWAPASNLTSALATYSKDDFLRVMRSGIKPDGSPVKAPMNIVIPYGARSEEIELSAMWTALRAKPVVPDGI